MKIVPVTDPAGKVVELDWLRAAETVHRQLRPTLPENYVERMQVIFEAGGRMKLVIDEEAGKVLCVAVWRVVENTAEGRRLYVDDLVSDESRRSQGAGRLLLERLETKATALGCQVLALDSGVQRARAHHFYFRAGMHISAFCFRKAL